MYNESLYKQIEEKVDESLEFGNLSDSISEKSRQNIKKRLKLHKYNVMNAIMESIVEPGQFWYEAFPERGDGLFEVISITPEGEVIVRRKGYREWEGEFVYYALGIQLFVIDFRVFSTGEVNDSI